MDIKRMIEDLSPQDRKKLMIGGGVLILAIIVLGYNFIGGEAAPAGALDATQNVTDAPVEPMKPGETRGNRALAPGAPTGGQ
ncbi:MAG: hypothetical protein HUU18_04390 [Phycisphaerales bacterium]|nr:hypothetical protein [Phycisphaerales bacterium]